MALSNRILLVDDEEPFLEHLASGVRAMGFRVEMASSGRQALRRMEELPVEVVVLDVIMPEMDGLQTLKQIKEKQPATEVIILTGHGSVETAFEGMILGAFDYLVKPCEMEVLEQRIRRAQEKKGIEEDEGED